MLAWITNGIKNFFTQLIMPVIIIGLLFYTWGIYQKDRLNRTFDVSFYHIDGLEKGAPVYAMGAVVGKVLSTKVIINEEKIVAKLLVTKTDFPTPGPGTEARIVPSLQRSGAKVIELTNIQTSGKGLVKGIETTPHDKVLRLSKELFLITKDFANDVIGFLGSPKAQAYKSDLEKSIQELIRKVEQGDYQGEAETQLKKLNELAKQMENKKDIDEESMKKQLEAIKKTLITTVSVSDIYKKEEKKELGVKQH